MIQHPIDVYLQTVVSESASDLYLSANIPPRIRTHGQIHALGTDALPGKAIDELLRPIMDPHSRSEWEKGTRNLDFSYDGGSLGRFRVNAFYQRGAPAAVLRSISSDIPTADQLGLPETVRQLAFLRNGLVFVTGATGEGKSSTMAAIVDLVNRQRAAHVVTIEDPIEFRHEHLRSLITQREIGRDVESFPDALRAALRQALDVIVVGEVRDPETLALSLQAAETGHLVLGTLHTISAVKAIGRAVGMADASQRDQVRGQLSEVLRAVVAQRLVPRVDGGRVAAFEILLNQGGVPSTIERNNTAEMTAALESQQYGMQTMEQSLVSLVISGKITTDEAFAHANDSKVLEQRLRQMGIAPRTTY